MDKEKNMPEEIEINELDHGIGEFDKSELPDTDELEDSQDDEFVGFKPDEEDLDLEDYFGDLNVEYEEESDPKGILNPQEDELDTVELEED